VDWKKRVSPELNTSPVLKCDSNGLDWNPDSGSKWYPPLMFQRGVIPLERFKVTEA
jgi:hypothetical protein